MSEDDATPAPVELPTPDVDDDTSVIGDWRGRIPKELGATACHRRAQGEWRHRVRAWPAGPPTEPQVRARYETLPNYLAPTHGLRDAVAEGTNLMSPAARSYTADRLSVIDSLGGKVYRPRLYLNTLSSQPLAFSVAGELRELRDAAANLLNELCRLPAGTASELVTLTGSDDVVPRSQRGVRGYQQLEVYTLAGVEAEWFPPRWAHTGDRSGFDIACCLGLPEGRRVLVSIEVKYTDSFSPGKVEWAKYGDHLAAVGLDEGATKALVKAGCSQVLRQVMITDSVRRNGLVPDVGPDGCVDEVLAVVLAREDDKTARRVVRMLDDATNVPVQFWSHRQLFATAAKQPALEAWAQEMADRYVLEPT
jgi:hypothetical protein